ncbi:MAG: imidazole glycerol phosphate synthase subunit HisH [Clostridium sp.]|nr:imidazole glycerol phosphate synthase subunit HisH [Clostridium sp.]
MKVAIVKYNAGNIRSVVNALNRLGIIPTITDKAEELKAADRVLFPGQGEASTTMAYLKARRLDALIRDLRQPVLGICIGQQLMCRHSEEGNTECLGIFDADVLRFNPQHHKEKVPHMGWNQIHNADSPLFRGCGNGDFVYFVHSYYVPINPATIAVCDYVQPFSAALHKENFYATQFHPEKSGDTGERILQNFLDLSL